MSGRLKRRIADPLLNRVIGAARRRPWARYRLERQFGRPNLHELSTLAPLRQSTDAFLADLYGERWTKASAGLLAEHHAVQAAIAERSRAVTLHYPSFFTVEDGTALVLYAAVRLERPAIVVETGVADGRSTATVLAAMEANQHGRLHSIEVAGDVGALVADRSRWTVHLLSASNPLQQLAESLNGADIFIHDGDHTVEGQSNDAVAALTCLRPGGLWLSDDIDWSYVFHDRCKQAKLAPALLFDTRKVFGAVRLPG
jgi:predicted O-methyltransferase YrrM